MYKTTTNIDQEAAVNQRKESIEQTLQVSAKAFIINIQIDDRNSRL